MRLIHRYQQLSRALAVHSQFRIEASSWPECNGDSAPSDQAKWQQIRLDEINETKPLSVLSQRCL